MKTQIKQLLAQQGQQPVIASIDKSIRDFKRLEYTRGEIKETIREFYFGLDGKVDEYIISIGY